MNEAWNSFFNSNDKSENYSENEQKYFSVSNDEIDNMSFLKHKDYSYLYQDGDLYYFMDKETYEQITLNEHQIENDTKDFLIENINVTIVFNQLDPIEVRLPSHISVEIIE